MAVTKVQYFYDNTLIGEKTSTPFDRFKWSNMPAGNYQLTAKLWVDGIEQDTSEVVNLVVTQREANLIIGDPDNNIPTATNLASRLSISEAFITEFNRVNNRVEATITQGDITLYSGAFRNINITSFEDLDGNITHTDGSAWRENSNMTLAYLPGLVDYTSPTAYNANFMGITADLKIYANIDASTCNGGSPDPDLVDDGHEVVFIDNYTSPTDITDISTDTIYGTAVKLNFTPPASVNTLQYYEVYVDGVRNSLHDATGDVFALNLSPSTSYNIQVKAIDIYYNKSEYSNTITETTTALIVPTNGLVSYYKLDGNVLDSHGGNNGTSNTGTTVVGKISNGLNYNGSQNSSIPIDISSYTSFSIDWWFKTSQNSGTGKYMFQHVGNGTSGGSFQVAIEDGKIAIRVYGAVVYNGDFNDNSWHHIAVNVPQNATTTDIEVYVDLQKLSIDTDTATTLNLASNSNIYIAGSAGQQYSGILDELPIYNRVRDLGELSDRFNNGNGVTL